MPVDFNDDSKTPPNNCSYPYYYFECQYPECNCGKQKFKIIKRNKYLLIGFVVCCILVAWLVGDLIVYSRSFPPSLHVTTSGAVDTCMYEGKLFTPRNGFCHSADIPR